MIYEVLHFIEIETQKNNPDMGNPPLDTPSVETPTKINTNITNTKKQIDKDDKTKVSSFVIPEEHNRPTLELLERGYIREYDAQIFYYDKLFGNLLEEGNAYKDLLMIIHYIIPKFKTRHFGDEDDNPIENRFGYFKNAIISNINMLNADIEALWGEDEYDLTDFKLFCNNFLYLIFNK